MFFNKQQLNNLATTIWYNEKSKLRLIAYLLWPIAWLYNCIVIIRRLLYRIKILPSTRVGVPIIVVGNISVGGTGKTPLTIFMYEFLRQYGFKPGIISRGYSGSENHKPTLVTKKMSATEVGDEPLLIYQRTSAPIVIAKNRVAAAQTLLKKFPKCDILLSDDGLQHYALQRDIEIAVLDGTRLIGNQLPFPAGPLRETKSRLNSVDLIVVNSAPKEFPDWLARLQPLKMHPEVKSVYKLENPNQSQPLHKFAAQSIHAVAAIGNPQRFFELLNQYGIRVIPHAFADHHKFIASDFQQFANDNKPIFITEKDAVKCRQLNLNNIWVVAIDTKLDSCTKEPKIKELLDLKVRKNNSTYQNVKKNR